VALALDRFVFGFDLRAFLREIGVQQVAQYRILFAPQLSRALAEFFGIRRRRPQFHFAMLELLTQEAGIVEQS
jgi:hypothetical protein